MNSFAEQQLPLLDMTLALRHELMPTLTDEDLAFQIAGNPTLGGILKQFAETEQQYADSFVTAKHDWSLTLEPELATSVEALKARYAQTEQAFKDKLSSLSEEDVANRIIDREHMQIPVSTQFHIYREAFLIYSAKIVVYLRAMGKEVPEQLTMWIG
ncbi:MAG: hypothetical protein CL607_07165 [Anaerolineaceae bacterium]|nr:hypothetical protein [Anaerolineaceae bacterium]